MQGLWICDTEGTDLMPKIDAFHCLVFKLWHENKWAAFIDYEHPEYKDAVDFCKNFRNEDITIYNMSHFNAWVATPEVRAVACHNIYGFDLPAMHKLLGTTYSMFPENINGSPTKIFDTLSMSQGLYPDRMVPHGCPMKIHCPVTNKFKTVGGHGLQSWGYRVANMKPAIDDWRGQPLRVYLNRCIEDVIINEDTWDVLVAEMKETEKKFRIDWSIPLRRNMKSDFLMRVQEHQGVVFDITKAEKLRDRVDVMQKTLEENVEPQLPERMLPKSKQPTFPAKPFDGSGNFSSHGINWLRKLGYEFDEEVLGCKAPPKTAFKKDSTVSTAGKNYCIKHEVTDETLMPEFIRGQIAKSEKPIFQGGVEAEAKARQDILDKVTPNLMEPMRLSNQADIKQYLVEQEGWRPTLWGTKDITKDERKQQKPKEDQKALLRKYVQHVIDSPFRQFILDELGYDTDKKKESFYSGEERVIDQLLRKARYLPTTPQFKDQRGVLCPALEFLKGEMTRKIVRWLSLRNRRSVIQTKDVTKNTGWLNNERLTIDGKLSAAYTGLTNTNRRKHTVVANVPKNDPDVLLGKEMRELFTVPQGMWQIGTDASNLEGFVAAWLAWDFDNGVYYEGLSGDPHTTNAEAYSKASGTLISRGDGKAITYGVMYGAQAAKVAAMLGISKDKAQDVIDAFWDTNFGLKGAKEALEKYWEGTGKKFIRGIDGRKIFTRSKHSLLNARIQSCGALLMDLAGVIWHEKATEAGLLDLGVARTIYYHDEYQHQIPENLVRWKHFPTGLDNRNTIESVIQEVAKAAKNEKKGKAFKTNLEIADGLNLTLEQVYGILSAKKDAENLKIDGFVLAGNIRLFDDGSFGKGYTKAGQLMVEAIEEATKQMGCPFDISGEYMLGKNWGECH